MTKQSTAPQDGPYDALKTRCENCETLLLDEQVIMTADEVPLCRECDEALKEKL